MSTAAKDSKAETAAPVTNFIRNIIDTDLADSWARIAAHGAGDIYTGELAGAIAAACAAPCPRSTRAAIIG